MSASAASVRVTRVTKRFGAHRVVSDVSVAVAAGEAVVLFGPSGCGKTTLLRLVAGLDTPDEGVIELDDRTASRSGRTIVPPHLRRIGFVFQDLALWPHMTVEEHLGFALEPLRLAADAQDRRMSRVLDLVHLTQRDRYPHQLSGGEQQRVALARALVGEPRLLLLDEPFSSLDHALRDELRQQVAELQRSLGVTMIAVTHDRNDVRALAQRVLHMRAGALVPATGTQGEE